MKVKLTESSDTVRHLEIEVPAETVTQEYERVFSRQAAASALPGFRKGKVPRGVLEAKIGAAVEQEALNELLPKATLEAVRQNNLRIVGNPSIESLDYKKAAPLSFKARVEVKPVVALKGSLDGLKLKAPSAAASDAEVDEQVQKLRERQGGVGPELETPAKMGDSLVIDFEGRIDGVPFPGGKAESFHLTLGRKQLIPGFEEGLVGVKKGETREVKVKFPDDYQAADVKGKDAVFMISVSEVHETTLPELNDEFAKSLGGVETVAEMKEMIKKAIAAQKERNRSIVLQDGVATQLLEKYPVGVPTAMVDGELNVIMDREINQLRQQGMEPSGDDGLKEMAAQMRPMAEKRARLSIILESVADSQNIQVTDEEFEADMALAAPQLGMTLQQTLAWVKQNNRELGIKNRLREEKALKQIIEKASITDEK